MSAIASTGIIGLEDRTLYPLLRPGSFVQIDASIKKILPLKWQTDYERRSISWNCVTAMCVLGANSKEASSSWFLIHHQGVRFANSNTKAKLKSWGVSRAWQCG